MQSVLTAGMDCIPHRLSGVTPWQLTQTDIFDIVFSPLGPSRICEGPSFVEFLYDFWDILEKSKKKKYNGTKDRGGGMF